MAGDAMDEGKGMQGEGVRRDTLEGSGVEFTSHRLPG
jgi:hypothetical protein